MSAHETTLPLPTSTAPTVLAHLVGEQTLPNLLAALAVRPARIVQIRSRGTAFNAPTTRLKSGLSTLLPQCEFHTLELAMEQPLPSDISTALTALAPAWQPTLLNLTGGTKLMSIGAHTWATAASCPSLYVDTTTGRFLSAGPHPLPTLPNFSAVAATLTLDHVLAAYGVPAAHNSGHAPTAAELAFGRAAATAWETSSVACARWIQNLRSTWLPAHGRSTATSVRPVPIDAAATDLAEAAVAAGWAEIDTDGRFQPIASAHASIAARLQAPAELIKQLEGGWCELRAADLMLTSGRFSDLRWSVQAPALEQIALGETDIIALDRQSLRPVFVSCKSSTQFNKPLEHLFALRQRTVHFGGTFAESVLWIARVVHDEDHQRLVAWCRAAHVRLVLGLGPHNDWLRPPAP